MEGGWKTSPPRVSSRAKSPGLIGLNNYRWSRLSVRIIGVIKTQFFHMVMYVFDNSNISQEIFAIDTLRAIWENIYYIKLIYALWEMVASTCLRSFRLYGDQASA